MPAPNLSESEWIIMDALWETSPQTASQIAAAVRHKTSWADNTVRTLLTRLIEKGAVQFIDPAPGPRLFEPAVERETIVQAESRSFIDRVFHGAAKPLLMHFTENARLTPDDVRELKRLLDQSLKDQ